MNDNIKSIKMLSGEEIISKVLIDGDNWTLINPRCLTSDQSGRMALAPTLFSADPKRY